MLRLRTLGGLSVEIDGTPASGAAAQRSRLALLALLAGSGGRGLSRDKVLGFLWPEAGTDKARHALRLALSALRRDLHCDDLFLESPELRLNPRAITSDVGEFERAAASDDHTRALQIYAGPFLDGFFLTGAPEFERWVENERARLADIAKRSLEALALRAASRGDHRTAVDFWRRLAALDPLSARVTIQLMRSLADAGDRGGALQVARVHEALMRDEFEASPDPAVLNLANALRDEPAPVTGPPASVSVSSEYASAKEESDRAPVAAHARATTHRAWAAIAVLVIVIGAAAGGWKMRHPRSGADSGVPPTIAVLPFVDLSSAGDHTYFGSGMAEELTNVLAHLENLRVVSQTSVQALTGTTMDVRSLGERLGVQAVLEGSVRRTGSRLRVTARLVDARTGYHRWSNAYDVDAKDVIQVQQDISRAIVSALQLHLRDAASRLPERPATRDAEAYDLYLRGRYYLNKRTPDGVQAAIADFQEAIRKDSAFARAYVGLSDAYRVAVAILGDSVYRHRASAAAEKAFTLDSSLGEALASLGELEADEWQWTKAEQHFRRAIALTPGYAPAHSRYGSLLAALGRPEQAVEALRRAHELDPLSLPSENALASQLFRMGRRDEAFRRWQSILSTDPDFLPARRRLALAHLSLGRSDSAIAEFERLAGTPGATTRENALLAYAYAATGRRTEAQRLLRQLDSTSRRQYVSPYHIALIHAALGDTERAVLFLEKACDERDPFVTNLVADQWMFPSVAADPRFSRVRARIGL